MRTATVWATCCATAWWNSTVSRSANGGTTWRDFAQSRLSDAERAGVQRRHATYYRDVLAELNKIYRTGGGENVSRGLAVFGRERANIQVGRDWAKAHASDDAAAAQLLSDYGPVEFYFM